jgi:hypothetical protein
MWQEDDFGVTDSSLTIYKQYSKKITLVVVTNVTT